jgi:hypothetical protein
MEKSTKIGVRYFHKPNPSFAKNLYDLVSLWSSLHLHFYSTYVGSGINFEGVPYQDHSKVSKIEI